MEEQAVFAYFFPRKKVSRRKGEKVSMRHYMEWIFTPYLRLKAEAKAKAKADPLEHRVNIHSGRGRQCPFSPLRRLTFFLGKK
ncbi:hypothetical protein [Pseudomonas sp. LR_7]|uniref:hypothetical protein n=1 Tax=Pseudomonas sp. LR_7 TaxID=3055786 RepID=UPI00365F57A2